jgi:hypothetical protein
MIQQKRAMRPCFIEVLPKKDTAKTSRCNGTPACSESQAKTDRPADRPAFLRRTPNLWRIAIWHIVNDSLGAADRQTTKRRITEKP